jgi:hypothetical protein
MEAIDLDKGVLRGAQNRLKDSYVEAPQASAIGRLLLYAVTGVVGVGVCQ